VNPGVFICHISDVSHVMETVLRAHFTSALVIVMKDEPGTAPVPNLTVFCNPDYKLDEPIIIPRKNAAPPSHGGAWQRTGKQWEHG
jgi:hypothetical protein